MEFRHLLVRDADRIRRIILNRPERLNALNVRIGVELLQALEDVDRDSILQCPKSNKLRVHARDFRVFRRERENRGLLGGVEWIRTLVYGHSPGRKPLDRLR